MSKTPTPLVYTPFKGTLYQFGVGFAYYSQQAVQSQNEVIGQFPHLILFCFLLGIMEATHISTTL